MKSKLRSPMSRSHSSKSRNGGMDGSEPRDRVPDETKNLEDTIFGIDTSLLLAMLGGFKLLLVLPLFVLSILLVSLDVGASDVFKTDATTDETVVADPNSYTAASLVDTTRANKMGPQATQTGASATESGGTETASTTAEPVHHTVSYAAVWTSILLAVSALIDFTAIWKREGTTIIVYTTVATISFVTCILCIEYIRLGLQDMHGGREHGSSLEYKINLSCIVVASLGVAACTITMYVGTRMAALEQERLYMEREGLEAVLRKKKMSLLPWSVSDRLARRLRGNGGIMDSSSVMLADGTHAVADDDDDEGDDCFTILNGSMMGNAQPQQGVATADSGAPGPSTSSQSSPSSTGPHYSRKKKR